MAHLNLIDIANSYKHYEEFFNIFYNFSQTGKNSELCLVEDQARLRGGHTLNLQTLLSILKVYIALQCLTQYFLIDLCTIYLLIFCWILLFSAMEASMLQLLVWEARQHCVQ